MKPKARSFPATYSWLELNEAAREMDEKQALTALEAEKRGYKRKQYMLRLFGRYNLLRTQRERGALIELAYAARAARAGRA